MAKTDTHKHAAATLRRMIEEIDTLTITEAAQLAQIVERVYIVSTAIQGKMKRLKERKRGRKPQDDKTLADIATSTAPAKLAEMISQWAQEISVYIHIKSPILLAVLAVALVEMGYLPGDKCTLLYFALQEAIPPQIREKFGEISTFRNRYRRLTNPKLFLDRVEYNRQIESIKNFFQAP